MIVNPKIVVDVKGAMKRLDTIMKRVSTLPWQDIGAVVESSIVINFQVGGRYNEDNPLGGGKKKWKKRKDPTLEHPILVKTGVLKHSFYVKEIKNGVQVGTKVKYAAAHNYGYPPRNLPARPFLVVQPQDMKSIDKIIKKHINDE